MLSGVPILFQKSLDVDDVAGLSGPRPNGMTGPHLNLRTHLRNRGNISGSTWTSECVDSGETKGVLALGRCPGPIGSLLYLYLFTFTKELQGILPIWDVMQGDFCMMGEISGMGPK